MILFSPVEEKSQIMREFCNFENFHKLNFILKQKDILQVVDVDTDVIINSNAYASEVVRN